MAIGKKGLDMGSLRSPESTLGFAFRLPAIGFEDASALGKRRGFALFEAGVVARRDRQLATSPARIPGR